MNTCIKTIVNVCSVHHIEVVAFNRGYQGLIENDIVTLNNDMVENIGHLGKYKGVGAHLFAIACKLSWDVGNEGYVQFTAKTNLVEHYRETLGARNIDSQKMFIDSYGALKLIQTYFPEEA